MATKKAHPSNIDFKVDRVVSSMSLSGAQLSPEMRETVRRVIAGELDGKAVRRELIEKHRIKAKS